MKITISRYLTPTSRETKEFEIASVNLEPYGEGTTDKKDAPCLTLAFNTEESANQLCKYINVFSMLGQFYKVDPYEEKEEQTWFIHFWHVPVATSVSIK